MKKLSTTYFSILAFLILLTGCEREGIDPLTAVDPGQDQGAPQVNITSPREGSTLKTIEEVSSIDISFNVQDDIEIAEIEVLVNGQVIATFSEFSDYRIVEQQVTFDNVTSGSHQVTVRATDLEGNQTVQTVNFSKEPPYSPVFANEVFYMPFDGDFMELVQLRSSEQIGDPGFANESFLGSGAYQGAPESYLTIPFEDLGESFTAAFWYKVSGDPDRAGILVAGADENRTQGFRLFREGSADEQRIKLNVGTGTGESWNDGGVIDVNAGEWVHVAFTVSPSETVIYLNGMPMNTSSMASPIDWTGVEELTIGHGGETFSYWNHLYDSSALDELRLFNTAMSQEEIQNLINASSVTLHMSFENDFTDNVANREVTVVGDPGFSTDSQEGNYAYDGATGSYLTMPSDGLLTEEFSATFWYKANADPDRAGLIVVGPEDTENPDAQNIRTSGFRLFREGSSTEQRIKLNVGTGGGESWNDGGVIDVTAGEWVHVAFTISSSETKIYLNGDLVNTASLSGPVDWTGTDLVSIMSGAPRFTGWNHLSDQSLMDDLRFYNKALTEEEIEADMAN